MAEKEQNDWKLYSVRKIVEYITIGGVLWAFGVPAINHHIESQIKIYEDKHKSSKAFREVLADEWNVKKDRVHIYMKEQNDLLNDIALRLNHIEHHVKDEIQNIHPGLVIIKGTEFWIAEDGERYRVHRAADGKGSYVKDGHWHYIFW